MGDILPTILEMIRWADLLLLPANHSNNRKKTVPESPSLSVVCWEKDIQENFKPILRDVLKVTGSESDEFFLYQAARIRKTSRYMMNSYFGLKSVEMSLTEFKKLNLWIILILLTLHYAERMRYSNSLLWQKFTRTSMTMAYHCQLNSAGLSQSFNNIYRLTAFCHVRSSSPQTCDHSTLKETDVASLDIWAGLLFNIFLDISTHDKEERKRLSDELGETLWCELVDCSRVMETIQEPRLRWTYNLLLLESYQNLFLGLEDFSGKENLINNFTVLTRKMCRVMINYVNLKDFLAASAVGHSLSQLMCLSIQAQPLGSYINLVMSSHVVFGCAKFLASKASQYNDDGLNSLVYHDSTLKDIHLLLLFFIVFSPNLAESNMRSALALTAKYINLLKFHSSPDRKFDWGIDVLVIFHMIMTRRLRKLGFLQQEEKDGGTRLDVEDYKNLLLFIRLSNPSSTQDSLKSILRICQGTMPSSRGSVISSKSRAKFYLVMMTYPLLSQELRITQSKLESSGESLKDSEHPILKDGDNRMYINSLLKNIQCVSLEYEEVINTLNSYSVRFSGDDTVIEYNNETCGEKCDKKMKEKNKVTSRVETVGESGLKSSSGKLLLIGEPGEYLSLADLLNKDISELFELVYSKSLDSSYIDANDHLSYIEEMRGPLGVGRFSQAIPPQEEFGDESWTLNEILLQLEEVLRQCVQALLTSCSQQSQHQQAGNKRIRKPPLESKENLKQMKCMMTRMKKNLPKDTLKRLVTVMSNMEEYLQ